ncbi:MAG: hypothetical protein IEMM0008_1114 [bacterium]|nr:MAG: hypothetical protein IEMM0008_1114 [bacterium]
MAEISEPRSREIVRDELSVIQIPQRLASIKAALEHKADVESLKGEMASFREEVNGRMDALREELKGEIKTLDAKEDSLRDLIQSNFRITLGIAAAILFRLIIWFFPLKPPT